MSKISLLPLGGQDERNKNSFIVKIDNDVMIFNCGGKIPVNSLYGGHNQFYYPIYSATVKNVEQTWWHQTYTKLGLKLGVNNSWSGSAAYGHSESAGMSDARLKTLDDNGTPNIVVIFLGKNYACM